MLARARADRAVMLSHRSILAAVEAIGRLDDRRVRDADRVLQVLPMYHVAGWVVAFLPTTLVGGATVIPEVGFDSATISIGAPDGALRGSQDVVAAGRRAAESAVAAAGEHHVTVVPGAPGFFHHLVGMDGAQRSLATVTAAHLGDRAAGHRRFRRCADPDRASGLGGVRAVRGRVGGDQHADDRRAAPRLGRASR